MEGKTKMKIGYFIKENKMETSNFIHAAYSNKIPKKLQNTSHTELNKEKNKIAHHKLALTHDVSTPRTV
jgi:hypothetical protein